VPEVNIGKPFPLGSTLTTNGVNFCLAATNAELVEILIFDEEDSISPKFTIELDKRYTSGPYWHAEVNDLKEGTIYAYRIHQKKNNINEDYSKKILIDPCSRGIVGWTTYNRNRSIDKNDNSDCSLKSIVCERDKFDFKKYPRPNHEWSKSIIYELHIQAFTKNLDSLEKSQNGCFKKIIQKIPYLKDLGITTIELLPIFSFDPNDAPNGLENFWGYSPVNWFTPHYQYFSEKSPKMIRKEFRGFVEACHQHNIEVILDVVYNHTSEGNLNGPAISWKGIDLNLYYFIDENKMFQDVSGCGNSIAANRSLVRRLIIESLKCWANEFGVDGFRFDLGIAMTRGENLTPLDNPPLFEDIEVEPELTEIKLISEPWDCGGLYKLHDFPSKLTFTWNGHFRDDVRRFWKGEDNTAWDMSDKIEGSPKLYKTSNQLTKSINFITSHDGFTLRDLVSFNKKHNFSNKEHNKDGENNNNSWNHGIEGPTSNKNINELRSRQQKNLIFTLLISRGVPMILMGDEIGRTQGGNNNTWCQNNALGWMNWEKNSQDLDLFDFVKRIIQIRKNYIDIINPLNFNKNLQNTNKIDYQWHGTTLNKPDWGSWSHTLAFSINKNNEPLLWVGLNAYISDIQFSIPILKNKWIKVLDTSETSLLKPQPIKDKFIDIRARSSVLLIADDLFQTSNL
tara:strand:+ start:116 stop:2152 length:2037 start_codon:yes stop_codon:yes gene_type:complete